MASSATHIHVLGPTPFTPSSSKFSSSRPNSFFFGQKMSPSTASFGTPKSAFLRLRKSSGGRRRSAGVGPVRVVAEKVVGIDLGTTNSAVAAMEGGKPTIVTNAEGQRTTPSVVAYTKNGERLVGQIAKRQAVVNPENTFFSVKRFIGRKMSEVDEESKQVSYRVVRDDNGNVKLECPAIGKQFAAEEISAQRIVDWLAGNFKRDEGIDLLKDKQALQRLTETAEKAKMELSSLTQANISLPFITATADGPKHIETTLTRAKFEELCSDLLDRLRTPVENSLRDAKLSFSDLDEVILVGGSTRIPAVIELVKKMTGKDPNVTVNPDEVVALGAAVQAGVLAGDVSDIVLLDVTPLSIGLETLGGVMTKIIPRNTTLPTSKSEVFSTAADGQTSVEINVLQGERKKQDITITGASTLPSDEVERMVSEAEKFSKEDKEKRDAIDTKNQADSVVYQTEKQLKELGEKVPAPVKEKVEAKLGELKDAISGGETQAIKDAMAALNQEVMQLGQSLYNQPGAGGAPGTDPTPEAESGPSDSTGKGPEGDVIDADFTDSK
uniref:Uncharacterized protein n=1 Tax=Chenopodium quinoa TaxID=63459 RepID=A0A803N473_CHEQI